MASLGRNSGTVAWTVTWSIVIVCLSGFEGVECIAPAAYSPLASPAPGPGNVPAVITNETKCDQQEVVYQEHEERVMLSALRAWKPRSDPSKSVFNMTNWNESVHPCDKDFGWRGVRCSDILIIQNNRIVCKRFIVELLLGERGLVGELLPELGNLINLQSIKCYGNPGLSGPIPDNIWNLPMLQYADFSNNNLSGNIHVANRLYSLTTLDLSGNLLTGWQMAKLSSSLQYLNLSHNHLSGAFETGTFSQRNGKFQRTLYPGLVTLDLSHNELSQFRGARQHENEDDVQSLKTLKLNNNQLSGEFTWSPRSIDQLTTLDLSNNNLSGLNGSMWSVENGAPSLQTLYLTNNALSGAFKSKILQNPALQSVFCDSNQFDGALTLPSVPFEQTSLNTVSMTHNNFTEIEYPSADKTTTLFSSSQLGIASLLFLGGNPLCDSQEAEPLPILCRYNRSSPIVQNKQDSKTMTIMLATTIPLTTLLLIVVCALAYVHQKNRRNHRYLLLSVHQKFAEHELKPILFAYSELQRATNDFHAGSKLGQGAFGAVYKGELSDGTTVAVKQLFNTAQQSMDEFLNEVVLLTGIKHRNLVKLKGCCLKGDRRLLVYEYVENSDLADILFNGHGHDHDTLNWSQRQNICAGVAQGLHYLHAMVDPKIIHRDIKASNVLLDRNMQPKIADFGLALLFPTDTSHVWTVHVAGTKGYLAPEYATLGQLSEKADVWSFGVLVLEIVSGRSNIDGRLEPHKMYLVPWAQSLQEEGRLLDLVDPTVDLRNEEDRRQIQQIIFIALLCLETQVDKRLTMAQVVAMLQGTVGVQVLNEYAGSTSTYQPSEVEEGLWEAEASLPLHTKSVESSGTLEISMLHGR